VELLESSKCQGYLGVREIERGGLIGGKVFGDFECSGSGDCGVQVQVG
jgi:hypothetical protein